MSDARPASNAQPESDEPRLFALARRGEGVPLVLLHGFGGDHTGWLTVAAGLKDVPTLAYDLPGHGRSLRVPGAGRAGAMAKGVLADLDRRDIERAHVAGHSMGGAVAAMMAMRAIGRIASLTLVAPGGHGPEIAIETLQRWADAASDAAIARALKRMTAPGHVTGAFEVARVAAMRRRPGQTAMLREIVGSMANENGHQGAFGHDALRDAYANVPTTLVWGTSDPVLPFHQTHGLKAAARIVPVDGAGHMLMEERRAAVRDAILENVAR